MKNAIVKKAPDFEQTGNAAAMREALEALVEYWDWGGYDAMRINRLQDEARAALAAPARNCDVPYIDEVARYSAFKAWCNAKGHTMEPKLAYDAFDWLFAPEGGAE